LLLLLIADDVGFLCCKEMPFVTIPRPPMQAEFVLAVRLDEDEDEVVVVELKPEFVAAAADVVVVDIKLVLPPFITLNADAAEALEEADEHVAIYFGYCCCSYV
jgi:hypothetical protein